MRFGLSVVVLCGSGIVAGVLFAVAVGVVPAFAGMSPIDYIRTHQVVGRDFDRVMPPTVAICVVADIVLAFVVDSRTASALFSVAALASVGVSIVSQFGNVPINRLIRSTPATDVDLTEWADPRQRWRAWHLTRTGLAFVALVATAVAVVIG